MGEKMARSKQLKDLSDYIKPEPTVAQKRAQGAADVTRLLRRLERKSRAVEIEQ